MEQNPPEAASLNSTETSLIRGEFTSEDYSRMREDLSEEVSQYVTNNRNSTNTQLFGYLALLNTYIPESYLSMSECQRILGPPDPIHGGPPFEQRMEPFTQFIRESTDDGHIYIHPVFAELALEVMVNSGMTRSTAVKNLMSSLCGDDPQPDTVEFIKDLLSKREMVEERKEKFCRLIQDISELENFNHVISVLKTASNIMRGCHIFPQTLARFYYIRNFTHYKYERAEIWAQEAIKRAPNNSFVADTLGQVYKNRLLKKAVHPVDILRMVEEAWQAFKDVENKAEREEGVEMRDEAGALYITSTFNNRGLFGLIQVAKIAYEKLHDLQGFEIFLQRFRGEVEVKFVFFEWYLTYSKPGKTSLEPRYFWKDVAECYRHYTGASAVDSTSFPGLLEFLNRGIFTSRGRYSGFVEVKETLSELEMICNGLKTTYEANVDDDLAAERYILSNVILSNRAPDSPSLAPLAELKGILSRFLGTEVGKRSPEFYLLVLLLFWSQEDPQEEDGEEVEQPKTEDDSSDDNTWDNKEWETERESTQPSQEVEVELDLQQYVTYMSRAFEHGEYSKYLRGRYLVPLFFLGKGFGLSKWIHRSKLDAYVETEVDAKLAHEDNTTLSPGERTRRKWKLIHKLWSTGEVWQIQAIQDILLPVRIDQPHPTTPQDPRGNRVFVVAGGRRILAKTDQSHDQEPVESQSDAQESSESDAQESTDFEWDAQALTPLYLGLTIQGPVIFNLHL